MVNTSVSLRDTASEPVAGERLAAAPRQQVSDGASPRERVVRDVIRGLYEGRYTPGQRLVEAKLTAAYGVSRGPVREALNRLAAMGIVSLTLQRGGQVRKLSVREAIDILVVVQGLVGIAGRLAASRSDLDKAGERMREALKRLDAIDPSSSAAAEYAVARDNFYAALIHLADNAELRRILPAAQIHLIRVQFRSSLQVVDRVRLADYHRIADAVLAGRPTAAEAAVRAHFARTIKSLQPLVAASAEASGEGRALR
jgi:DNA-binding GntR family transcriptional regulator